MDEPTEALEAVFARWALRTRAPGVAWGLIRDGALVASGGVGTLRVGEDAPPGADSVFRIASMTKSFTGAALLSLVAEGRIRLDEPVVTYVPELADWRGPTTDGPPLTVRHLVSMESGLPSDDPWADRHLDLPPAGMDALIAAGGSFTWTPGLRFEYSNLGWGLVGRVIERVAGAPVQQLVTDRLLGPLGMASTTWVRPATSNIAEPFSWVDDAWVAEPEPLGDGTIAPMGGLWTTVTDLARWVSFFCDAFPPRDDPDDGPLPRWARREMQQARRSDGVAEARPRPDGPARVQAYGYGIGLGVTDDLRLGTVIGHSGGLPGYGSHMRWIPDRGVGVVAVSNVTYGYMAAACAEALDVLADLDRLPAVAAPVASPALQSAADRAVALTLLGVLTATFFLVRLAGDPTTLLLPVEATTDEVANFRIALGLDQPLLVQYMKFVAHAVEGDFGISLRQRTPALGLVLERLPATLELALTSFILGLILAFAIGLAMRLSGSARLRSAVMWIALARQAIPVFWFGLLLILLFSVTLRWLPSLGRGSVTHLILPAITLSTYELALYLRLFNSSLATEAKQDYVRTAFAKGQSRSKIVIKHMLPNALLPLVTIAGINLGLLLGGTVVTETVFSWPGVGRLIVQSVSQRDYPVIIAGVFVVCLIFMVVNLIVDLLYAYLDPRVRLA